MGFMVGSGKRKAEGRELWGGITVSFTSVFVLRVVRSYTQR